MRNTQKSLVMRASVIAVRGALAALVVIPAAYALDDNEEVHELTQPKSKVELGIGYVNKDSAKFGEYNDLGKKGAYGIAGFELRGGASYDSDSAYRWSVTGRDLGLHTRNLDVDAGNQGKFRFTYSYDELQRNYADDYQTFYDGAGTTALRLPASFAATTAAQRVSSTANANAALSNWANIQSPYATAACAATGGVPSAACRGPGYLIPAAMHNFDVNTLRTKHNLGVSLALAPGWDFTASAARELKDGTKLTGAAFGGPARGVLVPEVINSSTDQFKAALGYVGEKAHFSVGYYASFYRNATDAWSVENPFQGNLLATSFGNVGKFIGAPDNEMQRLSISGGYNFTKTTRLVVNGNYQRMTQNEAFLTGLPSNWILPATSADAKTVDTSFNATLTSRPMKDLSLAAVYKYENRDGQTHEHDFLVKGGDAATAPILWTNESLNRRTQQVSLDADYALARRQSVKLGYDFQEIERSADGHENPFRVEKTKENTLRVDYRNSVSQKVTGRIGYSHAQRSGSEYEESVLVPTNPAAPLPSADPLLPSFKQFFLADRDRDQVRSALNFQVNETVSLQTGLDYNKDKFTNVEHGLKDSSSWIFKLDGAFVPNETLSFNAFYTYEDRKSEIESLVIARATLPTANLNNPPAHVAGAACVGYFLVSPRFPSDEGTDTCREWSAKQSDKVHTFGFGAKASNLMGGKFDLGVDLAYSRARTPIEMSGGAYFGNGTTLTAATAAVPYNNGWLAAESFPDITSNMLDLRLNGVYKLNKVSSLRVMYQYRRLQSNDWQYDAYANSAIAVQAFPGVGMTSPNYAVQAIGVSYIYTFK